MRSDELIDNVAKDMTALAARPALRRRVVAEIARRPRSQSHGWLVPTVTAAGCLAIATWVLMPARLADRGSSETTARHDAAPAAPRIATESSVSGRTAEAVTPARHAIARVTSERTTTRGATPALGAAALVWTDIPVAEIPMLPPLADPTPIVIEPIVWDEITIVPLSVESLEIKALVVEPLTTADTSGV